MTVGKEPVTFSVHVATVNPSRRLLIVFARPPIPGRVKSRLAAAIGKEAAASFYAAFLQDTLAGLESLRGVERAIAWSEGGSAFPVPPGWLASSQRGKDLGERLASAFLDAFDSGAREVVVLGSDSPTLPASRVTQAFEILARRDAAIGPTTDGGYYLIGLRTFREQLFQDVEWGGTNVLARTLESAAAAGLETELLAPWYDVDTSADLAFLGAHLSAILPGDPCNAPATRQAIAAWLGAGGTGAFPFLDCTSASLG
ncbi:MAG: TIGR04282 family arsenosugar biosynthesis glycosyltransferase [Planctomycetes bacterium]|nr:TIGR04282 family arsenosugar biosynthesis glycosyltransferase [Planctomycetota bacterium]